MRRANFIELNYKKSFWFRVLNLNIYYFIKYLLKHHNFLVYLTVKLRK
jgi:hypothetical protein